VEPTLPPAPKVPTLPNLTLGVPRKIPGLEEIHDAYAPSLSADLKTIVFAAFKGQTGHDLLLANRNQARAAFDTPQPLGSCNSTASEHSATLSPDGLDLVFFRSVPGTAKPESRLYHAHRSSRTASFGTPELLAVPDLPTTEVHLDVPQFLGDNSGLTFKVVTWDAQGADQHRYLFSERSGTEFAKGLTLPVANAWTTLFITTDGFRTYLENPEGIQISCRRDSNSPFGPPGLVQTLQAVKIGTVEGPFWIAPQEDVLFYCSSGVGKSPGSGRDLWMVRFR
jgi:hypothetical protein